MHHPSLLFFLLTLVLPLSASSPPSHHSHFTKHRRKSAAPPQEYVEVTRPLATDSLPPSCTLLILSHSFGNNTDLPPTNTTYSPPPDCTWSRAVLHLSAAANGSQHDRIAAVWLSEAELLRTSTPASSAGGVSWNVRKDVTRYSSLLRQSNLTLSVMLQNSIIDVYTGFYAVNLTVLYYNIAGNANTITAGSHPISLFPPNQKPTTGKYQNGPAPPKPKNPLKLDENPADQIIPISASGEEGFWFKIKSGLDAVNQGIQIPLNTYRAVIEVYASFHGNDEFWYNNPPDTYFESNGLPKTGSNGAYREVLVRLDDDVIGSIVPFPVIFGGGINPLFWEPVVSIGAFDLPSYEFDLTPFLGLLLDGKLHSFGFGVADAISFWLLDANLHLWLDNGAGKVQAGAIKFETPTSCLERQSNFRQLDGEFEIQAKRENEFSGWVYSSAGNFTTSVVTKLTFENKVKLNKNGTEKEVEQDVKETKRVEVKDYNGDVVSTLRVERKYPLRIKSSSLPGATPNTSLVKTNLEQEVKEVEEDGNSKISLVNKLRSSGWMFALGEDVLSGAATTSQKYQLQGGVCYTRRVLANNGVIQTDTEGFVCQTATS
ncbi:UNVERIFIED_CONTAM: Peptide-N4-(N-acetyl-beta-glucosaminyl)asparagine amidase A [Sesamum radiatum]|uniref:Peptide-N4-(N-acetyl-beta-glucosaminyl)asparagine amidase A n=1 Tax=Sesamum radiatum TaxID=300843 RepID=A0AAW2KBU6_SESRA